MVLRKKRSIVDQLAKIEIYEKIKMIAVFTL